MYARQMVRLALGLALLLLLCAGCAVPQPRGAGKLERIVEPTTNRGYWLYLPKDYITVDETTRRGRRWPLVVTFHGMKPFDGARAQAREWQQEADRYGFIVVAPELRAFRLFAEFPLRTINGAFESDEEATLAILDHVFQITDADPSNVLSTSWSSGGYLAHYVLNRHPDRFTCLAVRQSNYSATVLDPDLAKRSVYHPILILSTRKDFGICKRESKEAVTWYETHGYKNCFWVQIKQGGHLRTPDLAAQFFAALAGVQPNSPPIVLVKRQAIDGNKEGIAFLSGKMAGFELPPSVQVATGRRERRRSQTAPRSTRVEPGSGQPGLREPSGGSTDKLDSAAPRRAAVVPRRGVQRRPLKIRVSSAIGIEPLHLAFSAECPAGWHDSADFLWTLNGQPIGTGVNGQKTLAEAGEHTLSVLVVTAGGQEHRASRTIRVLPRLEAIGSSAGRSNH